MRGGNGWVVERGAASGEESGGYLCLEVFTSAFETKIRAAQVRKWSRNKIYT